MHSMFRIARNQKIYIIQSPSLTSLCLPTHGIFLPLPTNFPFRSSPKVESRYAKLLTNYFLSRILHASLVSSHFAPLVLILFRFFGRRVAFVDQS